MYDAPKTECEQISFFIYLIFEAGIKKLQINICNFIIYDVIYKNYVIQFLSHDVIGPSVMTSHNGVKYNNDVWGDDIT